MYYNEDMSRAFIIKFLIIWASIVGWISLLVIRMELPTHTIVAGMLAFACGIGLQMLLVSGYDGLRSRWLASSMLQGLGLYGGAVAIYLVYSLGTGVFNLPLLGIFTAYFLPPLLLANVPDLPKRSWLVVVIILMIWLPFDTGHLQQAWPWPLGKGGNAYAIPLAVIMAYYCAVKMSLPTPFHWSWKPEVWRVSGVYLAGFIAFAIAAGYATGFIAFNPQRLNVGDILTTVIVTFFLVAVPEELLFRGMIQDLLKRWMRNPHTALVIASVIFGVAHANNVTNATAAAQMLIDWRYVVIASFAGYVYGKAYEKTGSLIPAVVIHTAVDVIWSHLFYIH